MVSSATGSDVGNYINWANPQHPTEMIDLATLGPPQELPKRLQMHYFDCNAPGTTGYTLATNGFSIAMIHAHKLHNDTQFYKEIDASFSRLFFIYMPLDEGEYITEICRRFGFGSVNLPSLCLVVRTQLFPMEHESNLLSVVYYKQREKNPFWDQWPTRLMPDA